MLLWLCPNLLAAAAKMHFSAINPHNYESCVGSTHSSPIPPFEGRPCGSCRSLHWLPILSCHLLLCSPHPLLLLPIVSALLSIASPTFFFFIFFFFCFLFSTSLYYDFLVILCHCATYSGLVLFYVCPLLSSSFFFTVMQFVSLSTYRNGLPSLSINRPLNKSLTSSSRLQ